MQKFSKGRDHAIEVHHLIEKRFEEACGVAEKDILSVVVTRAEHQVFTNGWNALIPRGTSGSASYAQIMAAAAKIYKDYPELMRVLGL